MKTNICRFKGDSELLYEITEWLRNRLLDQKFAYLWKWSEKYYEYGASFSSFSWVQGSDNTLIKSWSELLYSYLVEVGDNKINFISIACWNSVNEIGIINSLWKKNIHYIWVDYTEEMINLSAQNLEKVTFDSYLIRSDIVDVVFKRYLDTLVMRNEKRFFSFLWNTFWNIKTTNVVDLLGSYLKKGDMVWIDVVLKEGQGVQSNILLFNHYKEKILNNEKWREFVLWGFNYIDFPIEKWKIIIEIKEDSNIWYSKIIYSIELLENVEFNLEWPIIFSKWEKISFFEIYFYEFNKLKQFMKIHHFNFIDSKIEWSWGQLLFEKE